MKTPKKPELLFPITTDGSTTYYPRLDYQSLRFGQLAKKYPGAELTVGRVGSLLELAAKEEELMPDAHDDLRQCFFDIEEDYRLAKENALSPAVPEGTPPAEPVIDEQLQIVEAATGDFKPGEALAFILQNFNCGNSFEMCQPKEELNLSDVDVAKALPALMVLDGFSSFGIGDVVNYLESKGHKDAVIQVCAMTGRNYQTISKKARTAERCPLHLRGHLVEPSQYEDICCARYSKDPAIQAATIEELITEAHKNAYNVTQTREAVLLKQGKQTKPTPPPAQPLGRYIVVDRNDCGSSFTTDNLPEPDPDHILVDRETNSIACSCCSAGIPIWEPLVFQKLEATEVPDVTATEVEEV